MAGQQFGTGKASFQPTPAHRLIGFMIGTAEGDRQVERTAGLGGARGEHGRDPQRQGGVAGCGRQLAGDVAAVWRISLQQYRSGERSPAWQLRHFNRGTARREHRRRRRYPELPPALDRIRHLVQAERLPREPRDQRRIRLRVHRNGGRGCTRPGRTTSSSSTTTSRIRLRSSTRPCSRSTHGSISACMCGTPGPSAAV